MGHLLAHRGRPLRLPRRAVAGCGPAPLSRRDRRPLRPPAHAPRPRAPSIAHARSTPRSASAAALVGLRRSRHTDGSAASTGPRWRAAACPRPSSRLSRACSTPPTLTALRRRRTTCRRRPPRRGPGISTRHGTCGSGPTQRPGSQRPGPRPLRRPRRRRPRRRGKHSSRRRQRRRRRRRRTTTTSSSSSSSSSSSRRRERVRGRRSRGCGCGCSLGRAPGPLLATAPAPLLPLTACAHVGPSAPRNTLHQCTKIDVCLWRHAFSCARPC
jgi:hypothetical protein